MGGVSEVREYLDKKDWEVRKTEQWATGTQLILDCPLCGKKCNIGKGKRRFYINANTGLWETFCCDAKGNLLTLKRRLGDLAVRIAGAAGGLDPAARALGQRIIKTRGKSLKILKDHHTLPSEGLDEAYHGALMANEESRDYVMRVRGFNEDTVKKAKLGLREDGSGKKWLSIPQYLPDGKLAGFKYRILPGYDCPERFRREPNCPTLLYGSHNLGEATSVTLYEAELDALSGDQMGLPLGLSSTAGARAWQPEWTALLAGVDTIFIAYDNDESGDEGAEKVAEALGRWRCRRVVFPCKDANECLASGLTKEAQDAFIHAESSPHPMVTRLGDFRDGLMKLDRSVAQGKPSGMPTLDALLGGRRGGELTIVSGETGQGKTTLTSFLAWRACSMGDPTLIGSFEHTPVDEALKLVTMEAGRVFVDMSQEEREVAVGALHAKPLYQIDAYGTVSAEVVFDTLRYFYRACGGRLAVIDHLHFVLDLTARRAPHEQAQEFLIALARLLKSELTGLHVMLVCHPKNDYSKDGKPGKVGLHSLKGGSAIRQLADNVMVVEKAKRQDGVFRAYVKFVKVRSIMGEEGELVWTFDKESLRFDDRKTSGDGPGRSGGSTGGGRPGIPPKSAQMSHQLDGKSLAAGEGLD